MNMKYNNKKSSKKYNKKSSKKYNKKSSKKYNKKYTKKFSKKSSKKGGMYHDHKTGRMLPDELNAITNRGQALTRADAKLTAFINLLANKRRANKLRMDKDKVALATARDMLVDGPWDMETRKAKKAVADAMRHEDIEAKKKSAESASEKEAVDAYQSIPALVAYTERVPPAQVGMFPMDMQYKNNNIQ